MCAIRPSFMMTATAVRAGRTLRGQPGPDPLVRRPAAADPDADQNPKPLPARLAVTGSQACARQGSPNMPSTARVIEYSVKKVLLPPGFASCQTTKSGSWQLGCDPARSALLSAQFSPNSLSGPVPSS